MAREINFELGARAALLQGVFEVAEAAKFTMAALVQSVSELREAFRVTMGSKVLDFYIMCTERAQCVMNWKRLKRMYLILHVPFFVSYNSGEWRPKE